jgi:predicted O-methyltransferase YrrM
MTTDTPPPHAVFSPGWPSFSTDWFVHRIPQWKQFVVPALAGTPARWLELGSYEGRSALWTLEHVLNHPDARLICVDIWTNLAVSDRFDANILGSPWGAKVTKVKSNCFDALRNVSGPLDCVYVDADHQAKAAIQDAAMVWPLLRRGGFLIWDDYLWTQPDPAKLPPKPGIDAFLELWKGEYELLHHGYQVIIRKL